MKRNWLPLLLTGLVGCSLFGCSTMTTPVLRHETGETLGAGRLRLSGHFESSRLYAFVPSPTGLGIEQKSEVFQGSLLKFQASGGVAAKVDLQVGGFLAVRGGGWRLGGKYQFWRKGDIVASAMLGYGVHSSSGEITYYTEAQPVDVTQVLSAKTVDISVPVSYRFNSHWAVYSGLMLFRSSQKGSSGDLVIDDTSHDIGTNLGVRLNFDRYEFDLEMALLSVHDPFTDSLRIVPYLGLGVAALF